MADQDLLTKLKALTIQDPDKEDDAVPYDPNAGTLTNIGRFLANNAMSKSNGLAGGIPAAGAIEAVGALAPEVAPAVEGAVAMGKNVWAPAAKEAVEEAPAAIDKIKGLIQSGKNSFAPISEEAPATLDELKQAMDTAAEASPYSDETKMAVARYNAKLKGK